MPGAEDVSPGGYENKYLQPNGKAKCLACEDLTPLLHGEQFVGCNKGRNREEYWANLRGDGLSHHPLRALRPRKKWNRIVGSRAGATAPNGTEENSTPPPKYGHYYGYPQPTNWRERYQASVVGMKDFLEPNEGNPADPKLSFLARAQLAKEDLANPIVGLVARARGQDTDPEFLQYAAAQKPGRYHKLLFQKLTKNPMVPF